MADIDISDIFSSSKAKDDLKFTYRQLESLPDDIAVTLFKDYVRRWRKNQRSANIWLRSRVSAMATMLQQFPIPLFHINTEIRRTAIAKEWADRCASILHNMTECGQHQVDALELIKAVKEPADQWDICPLLPSFENYHQRKYDGEFESDLTFYNLISGALARLIDDTWWVRQLNKVWGRYEEHAAIITGKVRAGVSPYVSNKCLNEYKQKKQAAMAWLNSVYAINEEQNYQILLAEAVASSVANPAVRRAELMVRMRGFEDLAQEQGFVGEFYTWTAPSKYHSWKKSKKGPAYVNTKYQGASPRNTQQYLCSQWSKCRAKFAREGIEAFGFRVVEPHHDGTPHWHLLLFIRPDQVRQARSIMRHYALEHDKHDLAPAKGKRGANFQSYRPRFDFKTIDPSKGSATGYIAKYIAKNIDGAYVDNDYEAESSGKHGAQGVAAWSSKWSIRQFQQIGGPSVTVWRELRRLKEAVKQDDLFETIRRNADCSNWTNFVNFMGGTNCPRKDRPLQLLKKIEKEANQYGEDTKKIIGVFSSSHSETTHVDGWKVSKYELGSSALASSSSSGDNRAPWSTDNNCTHYIFNSKTLVFT